MDNELIFLVLLCIFTNVLIIPPPPPSRLQPLPSDNAGFMKPYRNPVHL